jgi:RNA polymerase sigma-70 factor (ECF subfamily)
VQAGSTETLAGVLAEDVRASFPPMALWVDGRDDVLRGVATSRRRGAMRGLVTAANMQPAAALYLRSPDGDSFALAALAVLRIADGTIAEIVEFSSPDVLSALGLPAML